MNSDSTSSFLTVSIVSSFNSLAEEIVKILLKKNFQIIIVTNDNNKWEMSETAKNRNVKVIGKNHNLRVNSNYLIGLFLNESKKGFTENDGDWQLEKTRELSTNTLAKTLLVFPFIQEFSLSKKTETFVKSIVENQNIYAGAVYVGQIVETRSQTLDNLVNKALFDFVLKEEVVLPKSIRKIYPEDIRSVSRKLIKQLFSFYGKTLAALPKPISIKIFLNILKAKNPMLKIKYSNISLARVKVGKKEIVQTNTQSLINYHCQKIKEELKAVSAPEKILYLRPTKKTSSQFAGVKKKILKTKKRSKKNNKKGKAKKQLIILVSMFSLAVAMPFVLMFINLVMLYWGARLLLSGNVKASKRTVGYSYPIAHAASYQTNIYSRIPIISMPFAKISKTADTLKEITTVFQATIQIAELSKQLLISVVGGESYNFENISESLVLEFDNFYQKTGFLINDIREQNLVYELIKKGGFNYSNLLEARDMVFQIKKIVDRLPDLLGKDEQKKYLLLFQNNMELRPAGGFIGSFAIVGFENGRMSAFKIYDVYSADGQLKGYVKAPFAIDKYLSNAGWYLRDSNWDPDFPSSAKTAEWFLEKEIDEEVDGVIAIDLEFIKKVLEQTGELHIKDYDIKIDANDFYEAIQSQVEDEFFPGSRKKATFLTALSNEFMTVFFDSKGINQTGLARTVYESLEERHVQIFLHDDEAQRAISELGWDGAVVVPTCEDNCYSDFLGVVEANLGVNKANYHVERSFKMNIYLENGQLTRELDINIKNTAAKVSDPELFPWYKVYLRVLAPPYSEFKPVIFTKEEESKLLEPDIRETKGHKQAGVFAEIYPGETARLRFVWTSKHNLAFNKSGEYVLLWRKQAGTVSDPALIVVKTPKQVSAKDSFLTSTNLFRYNTTLARDFVSRIYW